MKKTLLTVLLSLAFLFSFSSRSRAQDFVTFGLTAQAAACPTNPGNTSTSTSAVTIDTLNYGGASFTIGSTAFSGTVTFYGSGDGGTTWQTLNVFPSNSTTPVTTATAAGLWQANVSAYTKVCMLATTFSSGTITVTIRKATVSARAGGGGGGAAPAGATNSVQTNNGSGGFSGVAGTVTGQVLTAQNAAPPVFLSSAVPLCNGGAVIAATPYTLLADSATTTRDRTSLCVVSTAGAGTFHVLSGATAGTGFTFGALNDGAGTWTFDNNSSSDTFNITNGSTKTDAATSFTLTTGQHFSITNSGVSNGSGGVIWYVRSVTGGGAGTTYYATPLTAATGQWSGWALAGAGVSGTTNTGSWSKAGASDWSYTDAASTAQGQTTVSVADPVWMANASTSATLNTAQGWFDGSQADHVFGVSQTFASLGGISVTTNARYCMLMLSSGTLGHCTNNDSPCVTAIGDKCVGFQYSTNRSDTNWQCIVGNGTTQTTTSTGVAADTNTHRWEIQLAAAAATFFIDGVQVCNGMSMTNFPASGTGFSPLIGVQDLTASAITIRTIGVVWQTNTAH